MCFFRLFFNTFGNERVIEFKNFAQISHTTQIVMDYIACNKAINLWGSVSSV